MKLIAEVNNEKHSIEIKRSGDCVHAKIDDREYELEASEVEPNFYVFKHNNQIHNVYAAPNGIVNVGNQQLEVKLLDPKRLPMAGSDETSADGIAQIRTAMPGKVVRILVEKGAEVTHGEGIMVVEAMKMQNEMKSPKDGIVTQLKVSEGDTVNAGDVLAIIE